MELKNLVKNMHYFYTMDSHGDYFYTFVYTKRTVLIFYLYTSMLSIYALSPSSPEEDYQLPFSNNSQKIHEWKII